MRAGFGLYYGPGQFEDRIQPIENYIDRSRVQASDVPANALAYPVDPATIRSLLSIRGYTHDYPNEYNMQYGASVSQELPGDINLTVGYTGSKGYDMFLRGVGNVLDPVTRVRPVPSYGQIDFKTAACLDGVDLRHLPDGRLWPCELQRAANQRHAPLPFRLQRRVAVPVLAQQGHDPGLERSRDGAEHVRLRDRVRHQSAGHPAHLQRLARLPHSRRGLLVGWVAIRRHRQRTERRADQRHHRAARQHHGERCHRH